MKAILRDLAYAIQSLHHSIRSSQVDSLLVAAHDAIDKMPNEASPLASKQRRAKLQEELEALDHIATTPQKPGQARTMTICEGPDTVSAEVGHWYSPEKVASMIAGEREACAKLIEASQPPETTPWDCAAKIRERSNAWNYGEKAND